MAGIFILENKQIPGPSMAMVPCEKIRSAHAVLRRA
jgi:hypothetical protein